MKHAKMKETGNSYNFLFDVGVSFVLRFMYAIEFVSKHYFPHRLITLTDLCFTVAPLKMDFFISHFDES